jgi:hypothetical protein
MAIQNPDGTWAGASGTSHESRHFAEQSLKQQAGYNKFMTKALGDFLNLAGKAMIYIPILGAIVCILMVMIAGGRGFVILAKTFWLFGILAIPALYTMFRVFRWLSRKFGGLRGLFTGSIMAIILKLFLVFILSFAAGAAVTAPFYWLSYKYYTGTNMHFASMYSADYIQALPDGKAPAVYEKRFQKGKILAELSVGEKVTVNGITVGHAEYNITTADGVTGWIPRAALPEDNAEMLAITINVDGFDSEDIAIDREVERLIERYMDVKETGGGTYKGVEMVKRKEYSISQNTLNRSVRVNAQTPLMAVEHKAYKDGANFAESGAKVVLENILYADDCTLVYLTVTDTKVRDLYGTFNTTAWKKSLTVTDLGTGIKYPLLQADYKPTWKWEQVNDKFKSSIVFFFPPFKSRHFSLTREAAPLLSGRKSGYGGLLGLAASVTSGDTKTEYLDYNFAEIRVK